MQRLVITGIVRTSALRDGHGACLELQTSEGPLELRFTYDEAERLISTLERARAKIQDQRARSALPPLPDAPNVPTKLETAIDPVHQVAVVRARLPDETTQDLRIPRNELAELAQFLGDALKRFEGSADMRQ